MNSKIIKPWGFEIKVTEADLPYTGKIIYVSAGKRLSLQYHDIKTETITLLSGQAKIRLGDETKAMVTSQGYTISPPTVHRLEAVTDCVFVEVSTPEMGNTVRLEDDYSRPTETEEIRNSPNRGWSQN